MKQRVDLIPAELAHLPQLADLAKACFPDPWSETLFQQAYDSFYSEIWCAVSADEVVGYLVLSQVGEDWNVDDIAVHPAYRRQGIAAGLLTMVHERYPACAFLLEVRESNAPAIALYQSLGYVQTGYRKRYYTQPQEGAVLMNREAKSQCQ